MTLCFDLIFCSLNKFTNLFSYLFCRCFKFTKCIIISSVNRGYFTFPFSSVMFFIFFSCLVAQDRTPTQYWTELMGMCILTLYLIFGGQSTQCFILKYVNNCSILRFLADNFYQVEKVIIYSQVAENFFNFFFLSWMGIEFCEMIFLYLLHNHILIFSFNILM